MSASYEYVLQYGYVIGGGVLASISCLAAWKLLNIAGNSPRPYFFPKRKGAYSVKDGDAWRHADYATIKERRCIVDISLTPR